MLRGPPLCAGLLDHTARWLTRAAAQLSAPLPSGPDAADAASSPCSSPGEAASSPEPLSPTMVLSQGFLNLLLWDPEDDEFPEVGGGARPCGAGGRACPGPPPNGAPPLPPRPC